MANQEYESFSGKLDAAPEFEPFSGALNGENPKEPGFAARLGQGASRALDSAKTALTDDPNEIAKIAVEQARTALPQTPLQRQLADEFKPYVDAANKAEGFVDNVTAWGAAGFKRAGQLLSNPAEAGKMIAEQLPNSLPSLAGGFAGAKGGAALGTMLAGPVGTVPGAIVGGIAGGFAGGYGLEKGAAMQEQVQQEAQKRNIDIQNQAAVAGMVGENYGEMEATAQRKGVGTAGTDAILNVATMGLAGMGGRALAKEAQALSKAVQEGAISAADASTKIAALQAASAARNTLGAKAARGAGVVGAEMVGEGVSEAVGQKYAYGEVDAGQVIDESLMGLGTGAAMGLGSKAFNKAAGIVDQDATTKTLEAAQAEIERRVAALPDHQQNAERARLNAQLQAEARMAGLADEEMGAPDMEQGSPSDYRATPAWARPPEDAAPDYASADDEIFQSTGTPQQVDPVREAVRQAADAGGTLSAAAGLAMDSGAAPTLMPPDPAAATPAADPFEQWSKDIDAAQASEQPADNAAPQGPVILGADSVPLGSGGTPFRNKYDAAAAKKMQPLMRVIKVDGGYALTEKTPAQIAAQEKAGQRLAQPRTSAGGEPIPAHAFIASSGGISRAAAPEVGLDQNPRVGNRFLLSSTGMSMEEATQRLIEEGYLGQGASINDALVLIKTSLTNPQYTPEGFERIAQAQSESRFNDYLEAHEDAAQNASEDYDPFAPGGDFGLPDGFTPDDLVGEGYTAANPGLQIEVNALISQLEDMGFDPVDALGDTVSNYANATQDEFNAAARQVLQEAIASSSGNGGRAAAQAAPTPTGAGSAAAAAAQELTEPTQPAAMPVPGNFSGTPSATMGARTDAVAGPGFGPASLKDALAYHRARKKQADIAQQPPELPALPQEQPQEQPPEPPQAAQPQAAPEATGRHSTWRKNAIQAGRVARELGLEPQGKRLTQIVAEIDAYDAAKSKPAAAGEKLKLNIFGLPDGIDFLPGTQAVPASSLKVGDWIVIDSAINSVKGVKPISSQRLELDLLGVDGRYAIEASPSTTVQRKLTSADGAAAPESALDGMLEGLDAIKSGMAKTGLVTDAKPTSLKEGIAQAQANKPTAPATQAQAAIENAANEPKPIAQEGIYSLPTKTLDKDWIDSDGRRPAHPEYRPTARQSLVIDAVRAAKDSGLFYADEVIDDAAKRLNVSQAILASNEQGVSGGDFGMDVYMAGRYLDYQGGHKAEIDAAQAMRLRVGDKLGVLQFNDYKNTSAAQVVGIEGDLQVTVHGTRGAHKVAITASPLSIASAMDRAKGSGRRKDGSAEWKAARSGALTSTQQKSEAEINEASAARSEADAQTGQGGMFEEPAAAPPAAPALTTYTPADIQSQQQAQERAAKADAAAKRADAAAAQADDDRKRIAAASVAAADSFELGQDPMDSLTGQRDVFADAPAANSGAVNKIGLPEGARLEEATKGSVQGMVRYVGNDGQPLSDWAEDEADAAVLALAQAQRAPQEKLLRDHFVASDNADAARRGDDVVAMLRLAHERDALAKQLADAGYTQAEIGANSLGLTVEHFNRLVKDGIYSRERGAPDNLFPQKRKGQKKPAAESKQKQPPAQSQQAQLATETAADKPPAKRKLPPKLAAKAAEVEAQRAAYFAPGNVVASYAGHDRVVAYTPADAQGNWSVTVQPVERQGDKWVDAQNSKPRTHSTQPDARAMKAGPVVAAKPNQAAAPDTPAQAATENVADKAPAQDATQPAYTYTPASKIDSPAQGVLANAMERKGEAFARLRVVRAGVKNGTANRLDLLKAESAHKEEVQAVDAAQQQLERDANRVGLTTRRDQQGANPDIRFSFAGARAATADTMALATAQERLAAGEDAEAVRQDTGWHKGVDGRWRFEISDADAKLKDRAQWTTKIDSLNAKRDAALQAKWQAEEQRNDFLRARGESPSRISAETKKTPEFKALAKALKNAEAAAEKARDAAFLAQQGDSLITVGDVLNHPALFAAYPGIADVRVDINDSLPAGNAAYAYELRAIELSGQSDAQQLLSTLLHEIQHGIQHIEGFATGGSIESARAMQADAQSSAFSKAQGAWYESRTRWPSSYKTLMDQRMLDGRLHDKYGIKTTDEDGRPRKAIVLAVELRQKISEADKAMRSQAQLAYSDAVESELGGFGSDAFNEFNGLYGAVIKAFEGTSETPASVYKRLAGEVEARNTQARQKLTDVERRATAPGKTADVADADVIVVFNGKEMASAPAPANAPASKAQAAAQTAPPLRTPAATIRAAITRAYGKLLGQLEAKGLVTLTQTQEEAVTAAAQARADKTGGDVAQIKKSLMAAVKKSIRAWHGSPHRFDKFSTAEIGSGEGAQVYGWGLYFAGNREVAQHYREKLNDDPVSKYTLEEYTIAGDRNWIVRDDNGIASTYLDDGELRSYVGSTIAGDAISRSDNDESWEGEAEYDLAEPALGGALYAVDIAPDEDAFLLWDRPLSQQSDAARSVLDPLYSAAKHRSKKMLVEDPTGSQIYEMLTSQKGGDQQASEYLKSLGVPGIKYLDGSSRDAGEGSHNYVVFDDADVDIVDIKFSANGAVQGFFDPQTGQSFLVADNLTAQAAPGVLMHEVGIHMAADKTLTPLFNRAKMLLKAQKNTPFMRAVQAKMDAAGETSAEEAAAYMVEAYENDRAKAPPSVGKWLADLLATVKAWLHKNGILGAERLTVADIAAVARANARTAARGGDGDGIKFSRTGGTGQTMTEAFKRWFGNSKVVDADGKPLVVYHGTESGGFTIFGNSGYGKAQSEKGFWFSDFSRASEYAGSSSDVKMVPELQSWDDVRRYAESVGLEFSAAPESEYEAGNYFVGESITDSLDEARDVLQAAVEDQGASGLYQAYLNIKNPKIIDAKGKRGINVGLDVEALKAKGFDGAIIKNIDDPGRYGDFGYVADNYVAFYPEQIKSATGNNGQFDPGDADIRFSRATVEGVAARMGDAIKSVTATNIKERAGWKMTDWLGMGLQALGRRQLVDIYGDVLPLDEYNRLSAQMEADKNEVGAGADQLATAWGKLKDERQLAELMHEATLAQIDPEKAHVAGDDRARYQILRGRFDALTPDAQQVYRDARTAYKEHHANVRAAIKERIERSELKGERKAELLKQMDDEFFKSVKGVYFPLSRFGQYVVAVKGADGKVQSVGRAETKPEAEALRRSMLAAFPQSQGYKVDRVILNKEFIATRDAVGRGFMTELYGVLDKQVMDAAQRAELEDTLGQLYLSALPDLSWAKHGIHRKGTPGFSQDARRAYAQNMFHGARYLAKLRYSDLMQDELTAMQEHTDNWKDVDGFNQNNAQRVVDEFNKRHESMMNPKGNPISTALTSFGFIFYLGLSPASAMVNLSQTALVAYPVMGAKWGFGKAGAALLKASEQALKGKNDITASLSADERLAYDEAVRSGTIDVTMAHDLAGIAQGEDAGVMWKIRPVMKAASFMFHHAERFNRQVTFIAAYRLAREAGADHKNAFADATKATYDGHFDYSSGNRPRIMQGNVARVVTLFKQFGQNMVYTLARNAYQSVKGTEAEKKEARKVFAGLLVSHGLAAGALGLPMVTTLLAAASMFGGDDDEPWDAQVALQNLLADAFGQKPAEVLAHGISRLTPWDVSGRVGLDRLILPDVQEGLEGRRLGESAMTAALGPVAGIGVNMLKGLQQMSEGQFERGLESMLPTALRGPMKALRYAGEGVQDKSGISILDEVNPAAVAGQALGFSPSEARNAQEGKRAIMAHDRALGERRQQLVTRFAMAAMAKDPEGTQEAREAVARFNEKNPTRRILPMHLMASVRGRQKRIDQAQDGVYLPKNRRDAMEVGRFALEN